MATIEACIETFSLLTRIGLTQAKIRGDKEVRDILFHMDGIAAAQMSSRGELIEANENFRTLFNFQDKDPSKGFAENLFSQIRLNDRSQEIKLSRTDGSSFPTMVVSQVLQDESSLFFFLSLEDKSGAREVLNGANVLLEKFLQTTMENLWQSQIFLDSVVENIPNMIFVKEADSLRFIRLNKAGERLTGLQSKEIFGKTDYDLFPKEQAEFFVKKDREALSGASGGEVIDESIMTLQGLRYLHTRKMPIMDQSGRPQYLLGISEDITEKKEMEFHRMELLRAQASRDEAEKMSRAKSSFLANISHEVRTPLGAILGFAELASSSPELSDETKKYLATIVKNGEQLLHIVDEILDLSKVESDKVKIEKIKCSAPKLVEDVMSIFKMKALEKHITISSDIVGEIPQNIISDPTRLRQILVNLLGNAVKFTESGSVQLKAAFKNCPSTPSLGRLCFDIIDTGVGISKIQAEKLFQPFVQADESTSRVFGGTGLGLFLSRRLASLMGGDVTLVYSSPEKGSHFRVEVEVGVASSDDEPMPEPESTLPGNLAFMEEAADSSKSILVVDDSPDNQALIKGFLHNRHLSIDLAGNGVQAVQNALKKQYDMVLMDIQMPEMDGFEAVKTLREKGYKGVVVALTAHAMKGDRERCLKGGFDDYLCKPISRQSLNQCISRNIHH